MFQTWLMPVSRMVSVVEEKYLNASSSPSLSRLSGDSKLSLTLDQRKSAMARVGWCLNSWSPRPLMYWRAALLTNEKRVLRVLTNQKRV